MSFLLDPPALVLLGVAIHHVLDSPTQRIRIASIIVVVFIAVSALLYLDIIPWWLGDWMSGSDWMLNSGLDTSLTRQPGTDILAVVLFAAYPLWMKLGLDIGGAFS